MSTKSNRSTQSGLRNSFSILSTLDNQVDSPAKNKTGKPVEIPAVEKIKKEARKEVKKEPVKKETKKEAKTENKIEKVVDPRVTTPKTTASNNG